MFLFFELILKKRGGVPLEVSLRLWLAITVAGDAGGPVGSVVVELRAGSCARAVGGGDSDEGVPELDIIYICVCL